MADDTFSNVSTGMDAPARRHFAITPSDAADLAILPRALKVTVAGNVAVRDAGNVDIIYPVVAGEILPIRAVRVLATGTTATVVGWY